MPRPLAALAALLMPLLLTGCLLAPGKFVSTLSIDANRHFSFTYVGEVFAVNMPDGLDKGLEDKSDPAPDDDIDNDEPAIRPAAVQHETGGDTKPDDTDDDAKNRAIAAALMKEKGFRKAAYLGGGKYTIDYAISGTLDHAFVWPFNIDAEVLMPFIAIEPRANGTVRIKAPAFANTGETRGMAGADKMEGHLDGVFTLDTDAEIVSQNDEDGVTTIAGRKTVLWHATPMTKDAPAAVLRMAR